MEKRVLGNTGRQLSVIGFGGIIVRDVSPTEAAGYVTRAIDRGINYFDVAPFYGNAEKILGPAIEPYRDQIFLACKTMQRLAKDVNLELNRSLERLKTDHFDLYQFHVVASLEEADQILSPGGALEAFIQAKEQGLIHHIGFSAHSEAAALRLLDAYQFDSMLLPINVFCWRDGSFGHQACKKAKERGTGILALKSLAKRPLRKDEPQKWPKCWYVPIDTAPEARAALAFTLSQPVTAAVCPGHIELLWLACDAVDAINDMSLETSLETNISGEPIFLSSN